jgi:hypothetical protein
MGKVTVALVREAGAEFGVFLVKDRVLRIATERQEARAAMEHEFARPFALMGKGGEAWGHPDVVRILEHVFPEQLPWQEFWLN